MASIRVTRSIAADPTSTALLLAGPTALDFWPGLRRVSVDAHVVVAETDLPVSPVSVRAKLPRRTPTSFISRFSFSGPGVSSGTGVVTLAYETGRDGRPATAASFELDVPALAGGLVALLRGRAVGFLANLAEAAELRSDAA